MAMGDDQGKAESLPVLSGRDRKQLPSVMAGLVPAIDVYAIAHL
jgi:hypothetical protein